MQVAIAARRAARKADSSSSAARTPRNDKVCGQGCAIENFCASSQIRSRFLLAARFFAEFFAGVAAGQEAEVLGPFYAGLGEVGAEDHFGVGGQDGAAFFGAEGVVGLADPDQAFGEPGG